MASALIRFPRPARRLAGFAAAALALLVASPAAAAPTVVTVCGRDDAGGGLNLVSALASGGEIVIRCPAGQQVIEITATRALVPGTSLDGEGKVMLRGTLSGPLFTATGRVRFKRLNLSAPRSSLTIAAAQAGMILLAREAMVALETVRAENARNAFVAGSFAARGSQFVNMGDPTSAPGIVVDAERIDLRSVEVSDGFDHPLGGGVGATPGRPPFARRILIEDSLFSRNRNGLLISDASVTIRRSRFVGNGELAPAGSFYWGCCGGALTLVQSSADLGNVSFQSNRSSGFGGAIFALGSSLRLSNVVFNDNEARVGGALMMWGREPVLHSWGAVSPGAPRLSLSRTQFLANSASAFGGGLVFAGNVEGHAILFSSNRAPSGGAIAQWRAMTLPPPHHQVFSALEASSHAGVDVLSLSRPILVDNQAQTGAAILGGLADARIGNGLIVRNGIAGGSPGGAVLTGSRLILANSSIIDNRSPALVVQPGAQIILANSIVAGNRGGNCASNGVPTQLASSMQYPGQSCGTAIASSDPGLGGDYAPELFSAARGAGNLGTCAADPLVRGVDLYGNPRLKGGRCDIGAVERDRLDTVAAGLPFGKDQNARKCWLLVIFLLIFLIVLILMFLLCRRLRRKWAAAAATGGSP
jgi:predicted outer membrane repeat protein